ncbi:MAG: 3' terminal RNA ribose 2'-O-methyltransferase Hen1 [Actinophytocola sp.]|uniref:3' terminal RNA ribose 2'-O-methyltransferase Hen1 n=1 Tax=Actinophytocola sp. TaxID=1872138 RepID=UPI00132492C7|nr:3' terminal RNA ribose 2'-O-methyltransferase Hen1 [Actinophytocola sp.]MPZ81749.1 3' terminal RNA ribose 2'-O-methyltransferase Hen1 [Actinophytocola sp.]
MLLTVSTTHRPASDLGFLLHKHPDRVQRFDVAAGVAHVMYPEVADERCTAALFLEVDPVELVRSARGPAGEGFSLGQYVNDRPYAASSLLAVTLGKVFNTAMKGRCDARPELAATAIPLEIRVPVLPCRGGPALAARLFEPLGWSLVAAPIELDPAFPEWGASRYVDLRLAGTMRLADALSQLYVLLPVFDDAKHYWVSGDEIDKLIRSGGAWLAAHPERDLITTRYLAHQRRYAAEALARLTELDDRPAEDAAASEVSDGPGHDAGDRRLPSLADQRRAAILAELRAAGAARVVDLGCGEGNLLHALLAEPAFTEIVGVDVAAGALRVAAARLRLDQLADRQRARISLLQGSVTYADSRLAGYDAVVLSEVVEHVDPPRLPALATAVFGSARPATVLVTTPNAEYNVRWDSLPAGEMRHPDHRFEWTRAELAAWADAVAGAHGYTVRYVPVGPVGDEEGAEVGAPTQLAVFTRGNR